MTRKKPLLSTSCTVVRSWEATLLRSTMDNPHSAAAASTRITGSEKPSLAGSQATKTPPKPISTAAQRSKGTFSPSTTIDKAVTMIGAAK